MTPHAVISGRGGDAAVRRLLVGAHARRRLAGELTAMVAGDHAIAGMRLHRAKLKPGRKLSGWYTVDVLCPDGRRVQREVAVTWTAAEAGADTGAEEAATLDRDALDRGLATPFRTLERRLPRSGMRIRAFPLDPDFPSLIRLTGPDFASGPLPLAPGRPCRLAVIRYRPGERHVLRYASLGRGPGASIIFVKLHREGEGPYRRTAAVADWLSRQGTPVAALRPLAWLPAERATVYPCAEGTPSRADLPALQRAGAALRVLHSGPPNLVAEADPHDLDAELAAVRRACEHIGALLPSAAPEVTAVLRDVRKAYGRLPGEQHTLIHGDLKLDHIWPSSERLTLLDLDRCCPGDPAFDVGKLLADLRCRFALAGRTGIADAQRAFLDGYGWASSPRLERARVYEAAMLLKLAARRVPVFHPRWADLTVALVSAARTTLEDLATPYPPQTHHRRRTAEVGA